MNDDNAPRGSILFLGDSLTAEGDWPRWFPEHDVRNHGVAGDTTDQIVSRLDAVVDERPDAIAFLAGTNDLAMRKSVEHIVRNIEYALVSIRRDLPGVRMLLQSILPRGREFADLIQDANRHLRQFAPNVRAQYLDLWPAFAQEDGEIDPQFSDDRLHLNDRGYEAWLAELRPAVDRLDEAPPMSGAISIVRPSPRDQ
jgi:lysophospholipase L1-like esterase